MVLRGLQNLVAGMLFARNYDTALSLTKKQWDWF
jgi:hypothetical protein